MAGFSHVQSIWTSQVAFLGQLARFMPGTNGVAVYDPVARLVATAPLGAAALTPAQFSLDSVAGDLRQITVAGTTRRIDSKTLDLLNDSPGESAILHLDGVVTAGNLAVVHGMTVAGQSLLVLGAAVQRGIAVHRQDDATGAVTQIQVVADSAAHYLSGIVAIDSLKLAGQSFVLAVSGTENGITALRVGADGRLSPVSSIGTGQELPISNPTDLATVVIDGRGYAIVAAAGTGSLSVLSVSSAGQLTFASQVNDSLGTRFGGVAAIDTITWNGQVWVAAAGNDGGVTLFQLLPDGRLVLRDTLVDATNTALDEVSDLRFQLVNGRPELLVIGTGDSGLARLRLDAALPGGVNRTTDGADLLIGAAGGGTLHGGAGRDLLVDAGGRDMFSGGAGSDIFVFSSDAGEDRILDFNPAEDRIDLTCVAGLRSPAGLAISTTATGARIGWGDDVLFVVSHDRRPLTVAELGQALCFRTDRIAMPDSASWLLHEGGTGADVLTGTVTDETFLGGAGSDWITPGEGRDTIDGGSGRDMISYADLAAPVTIDLSAGQAVKTTGTDRIAGIENVTGSIHGDLISGDGNANLLRGLGGYDWFTATWGADTYDGGTGRDMVSYVNATARIVADLGAGRGTLGMAGSHVYVSIERLTGSVFSDVFYGAAGEEDFRGLGGDDWFVGSGGGKDRYDGGTGRDTVAYSAAAAGVTASLLLGRGSAGDAARDLYSTIENLTGSSHADHLTGNHDRNMLRGLAGQDLLIGQGGNDRLEGGRGNDSLDGGSGWDYAIFSGDRSEYRIATAGDVTTITHLWGGREDGIDSLRGIEVLVFADTLAWL